MRPALHGGLGWSHGRVSWLPAFFFGEHSVVRGVRVYGWHLTRGWEGCSRRVDLRGEAQHLEAGQAVLVGNEEVEWREAGLNGQDVGRGI